MTHFQTIHTSEKGAAAVEFAILVPIWLMLFFAFLDYGWYLTNLFVLDHAVASGARAGVKVKYWLEDEVLDDPQMEIETIARTVVKQTFWLDPLADNQIKVAFKDSELQDIQDDEPFQYLEVKVASFKYHRLAGYLPESMLPQRIAARSLTAFP